MSHWRFVHLQDENLHPPALDLDDDNAHVEGEEIPWVLLEDKAYVADRRNATTATADSKSGAQVQVTLCVARPPRVSYLCVSCSLCSPHGGGGAKEEEVFADPPWVMSTDADLVLLRIVLSHDKRLTFDNDLFIYRPAGDGGPSLTLLGRPPKDREYHPSFVGVLSSKTIRRHDESSSSSLSDEDDDEPEPYYMVAALFRDKYACLQAGQFLFDIYDSKLGSWATHVLSLEDQQLIDEDGFFVHHNSKVISIGGKDGTLGFVDFYRGILLCDLLLLKDYPKLRYIKVPPPLEPDEDQHDGRLSRDIAVVGDSIRFVEQQLFGKPGPIYYGQVIGLGWMAVTWSRLIASPVEDHWEKQHTVRSFDMDISNPQFELLPKLQDGAGRPLPPFEGITLCQPTLSLRAGDVAACFMIQLEIDDDMAWVVDVDVPNNKIQGVAEFDATRSKYIRVAYMHSGISKYLKRADLKGGAGGSPAPPTPRNSIGAREEEKGKRKEEEEEREEKMKGKREEPSRSSS